MQECLLVAIKKVTETGLLLVKVGSRFGRFGLVDLSWFSQFPVLLQETVSGVCTLGLPVEINECYRA